ncbi:MAG: FecR domain-containing protein [Phycisphaerae bacterium]|jgi:hypothetical protein|nr:FecR domain-containing protein [Phycisphaerae bacterium]
MSADPFRHRLVDLFLREELGEQKPPDLSQAILSRAFGDETLSVALQRSTKPKAGRRKWLRWSIPAAAAAAIVIAFTAWMIMPAGYPDMKISGDYQIASDQALQRGATITTKSGSALLEMGGYCRVEIKPWTILRIDGENRREQLFVDVGMVDCSVDSDVGRFDVLSELGSASVKGTRFSVCVEELGGRRQMRVKVAEGAVEVSGASVRSTLLAGQERTIIGAETDQPQTAPATKPRTDNGVGIDPVDPGQNPGFTSSSSDEGSLLREQIRTAQERLGRIEAEIGELREENRLLQKELDDRRDLPKNNERERTETEPRKHEQGETP